MARRRSNSKTLKTALRAELERTETVLDAHVSLWEWEAGRESARAALERFFQLSIRAELLPDDDPRMLQTKQLPEEELAPVLQKISSEG
jgi:hypothetical protein